MSHDSTTFKALTQNKFDESKLTAEERVCRYEQKTIDSIKTFTRSNKVWAIAKPINKTAVFLMKVGAVGKNIFTHEKTSDKRDDDTCVSCRSDLGSP